MTMAYDLALLLTTQGSLSKAGVFLKNPPILRICFRFRYFWFSFLLEFQIGYLGHVNTNRSKIFQPWSKIIAIPEIAHSHSLFDCIIKALWTGSWLSPWHCYKSPSHNHCCWTSPHRWLARLSFSSVGKNQRGTAQRPDLILGVWGLTWREYLLLEASYSA